ncbi:alpha/beta hydrolase family protein [Cupriavidus sp. 30B13]|uniref:alpha/beta hydrolase family protein n=1 Tax=Cupriavidus sp. 30B13 TaxID=3384241 RepID=UPI003B90F5C7
MSSTPAIFSSALHNQFGTWPLAYIPYGGADYGEILAVARAVGDGDDSAFHAAWMAAGGRLETQADAALAAGHRTSARELYLRASCFYATSFHPLYGTPVDPRLLAAFRKEMAAFDKGMALGDPPVTPMRIPFEHTTLPAYLIPAAGQAGARRPLLIVTNGYDATIPDVYFFIAAAASRRGYHTLLFDGPGQGEVLYEQGIPLRPDWETVVRAVVDFALALDVADPARIALYGISLGGYLAPRAASGEPRLAACIADPGQWAVADGFRAAARKLGATPAEAADLGQLGDATLARLEQAVEQDPHRRWAVVQRGFWVNGTASLRDYLASVETYTMQGRAQAIRCPTLLTRAEEDPVADGAGTLFEALTCPKTLLPFTAQEGAADHCETQNRSLANRRMLDWLDDVFGKS